jgi:hypothetical protein
LRRLRRVVKGRRKVYSKQSDRSGPLFCQHKNKFGKNKTIL